MTESAQHWKGKIKLEQILLNDGWEIWLRDMQDSFPFLTALGEREYYPDLMAWKDGLGWVVFEVDGHKGHWTARDFQKMKMRDDAFLSHDIRTVRISTSDLTGRKKQTDEQNLLEIEYQLNYQSEILCGMELLMRRGIVS